LSKVSYEHQRDEAAEERVRLSGSLWWVIAAVLLALSVVSALPFRHLAIDDKFIAAVYARNLARGAGWHFNPGDTVNASTSTLNPVLGSWGPWRGPPDFRFLTRCGRSVCSPQR
jgi:hypothetical protein